MRCATSFSIFASLRKWLQLSDQEIDEFVLSDLPVKVKLTPGRVRVLGAVPADPDDDMIIAAAVEADASYLVTEDNDLLAMGQYPLSNPNLRMNPLFGTK